MPVGPSHSHSGGGGGHFSGGHGGFSSGRVHIAPHSFIFFGRPLRLFSGLGSAIAVFSIFLIISAAVTIFGALKINSAKSEILTMEKDAVEYQEIIERAEAHSLDNSVYSDYGIYVLTNIQLEFSHKSYNSHTGKKVDIYEDQNSLKYSLYADSDVFRDGVSWYFIDFLINDGSVVLNGSTYTQYSQNQIQSMTSLRLAYHSTGSSTDVINADYKLTDNQQYLSAFDNKAVGEKMVVFGIVFGVIAILVIILLGIKFSKKAKLEQLKKEAEIEQTKARTEQEKAKLKEINRVCEYCGSLVPDGERKCPACGSSKFKN
ncbi:MAG: hypothetical protein IJ538_02970 [Clostridia bacterium]|nr:hypothetical protein [Clostridia bacterium]